MTRQGVGDRSASSCHDPGVTLQDRTIDAFMKLAIFDFDGTLALTDAVDEISHVKTASITVLYTPRLDKTSASARRSTDLKVKRNT